MAFAIDTYTGDGSTVNYSVTFPYIEEAHVVVTLDGVTKTLNTDYSFTTSSTITFTTAPSASAVIKFTRSTSQTSRLVDYQDGSTLTEATLDQDGNQSFYMAQEAIDITENTISLSTSTDQWDADNKRITNLASPVDDSDAVTKGFISTNLPNITTVAGISSDVTAVAGISSDVTTVANNDTNVSTVATNISSVNTVATNINDVIAVANDLAEAVSEVETVANDLNEATSEIDTVATNIANVNTVGTNIANVNTVAGINADVTTVAGNDTDISTVAGISANVSTVAGISADVTSVANDATDIGTVATDIANVNTVATNVANVNTVAGNNANITTVAGVNADVTTVAGISSDVTSVANNNANVTTVAGSITNVNNVGGSIASVNTVASNLASVNSFANTYLGASATAPTLDPDGSALDLGDLYFDTASDTMKVYSSGGWINAGSAVNGTANRFKYTATASQTTFTGADDNGNTLAYDSGFADIYLNGVKLVNGSDFTATTGTSIVLTSGASASDILEVIAYGTFTLSNFSITDANDVPALGSAGQALVVNSAGTSLEFANASSAEVYGFNKDSNGNLIVTTTNQGQDNISSTDFANFDDVLFSASGFTFSLNNGELIATI